MIIFFSQIGELFADLRKKSDHFEKENHYFRERDNFFLKNFSLFFAVHHFEKIQKNLKIVSFSHWMKDQNDEDHGFFGPNLSGLKENGIKTIKDEIWWVRKLYVIKIFFYVC